jgi:hypothetical protein
MLAQVCSVPVLDSVLSLVWIILETAANLLPYKLVYKSPLCYKSPWFISPLLAKGRCKICMAHRPSTIVISQSRTTTSLPSLVYPLCNTLGYC